MNGTITRKVAAALAALALVTAGCAAEEAADPSSGSGDSGPIVVGAVEFTENIILQEMYALVVEDAGAEVELKQPLASREVLFPAVEEGDVNLVPEYTGALTTYVTGEEPETGASTEELVSTLRKELEPKGIVVLEPAPAQDQDALVVTPETAKKYNLETVSDLAPVADELTAGGPPEEKERYVGLPGLKEVYGIEFAEFRALDAGGPLTSNALESGQIDVARFFSTQGIIEQKGWVLLEEDKPLIPTENIIPVITEDVLTDDIETALNDMSAELTTAEITKLNKQVDVDKEDPKDVARAWLEEKGLIGN